MLAAAEPALNPAPGRVEADVDSESRQLVERPAQGAPVLGRHGDAAQPLAEGVGDQHHMSAAPARGRERLEEFAAVAVPLEVVGRNVDEAPGPCQQLEASPPFGAAVAQRFEMGSRDAPGDPPDLGPGIEGVREDGGRAQSRYPPATSMLTPVT